MIFCRQSSPPEIPDNPENSPARRSRSPQINERSMGQVSTPEEVPEEPIDIMEHIVEIEEVSENDDNLLGGPEPVITEQEEASETSHAEHIQTFSEVPMVWLANRVHEIICKLITDIFVADIKITSSKILYSLIRSLHNYVPVKTLDFFNVYVIFMNFQGQKRQI